MDSDRRSPSVDQNPLDQASFYIEHLKYGDRPGRLESWTKRGLAAELDILLRDAGVTSMTGTELADAMDYYGHSFAEQMPGHDLHPTVALTLFADGLMHGIALAAGLKSERRNPKGR